MDHYAILGVSPTATNLELNTAFKQKKNSSTLNNKVRNSYNLLKNRERRNAYNRTRRAPNVAATLPAEIDYIYVVDNLTKPGYSYPEWDSNGIRDFQVKVNEKLQAGYKLHGDPIVTRGVINKRWTTTTYPTTTSDRMYSNNIIYQVMIKGMGGEQFTSYKLLPIRVDMGEQSQASALPEEMKNRDNFIKDINTHLREGWKLYNKPVELEVNRNVANSYAPWGYIYQAFVK
jgi:hypothetical protein